MGGVWKTKSYSQAIYFPAWAQMSILNSKRCHYARTICHHFSDEKIQMFWLEKILGFLELCVRKRDCCNSAVLLLSGFCTRSRCPRLRFPP